MAARAETNYRRRRKDKANTGALLVTVVVICFVLVMGYRIRSLSAVNHRYAQQEAALQAELEAEQARSEELEESRTYVQTREYIERMARERLGLVLPDETIIKPN